MFPNDEVSKGTSNFSSNLSIDDNGYSWEGNLLELKCFVQNDLKLSGKWSSQGGERKIFTSSTKGIALKWSGPTRKKLIIVNDTEENSLANALNRVYGRHNGELNSIAASEGLVNVSKAFFNKSARHEKSNKNVKNVSDQQVGKTCFISSVSENTCLNKEAHAANRNEIVNNGAKFEENNRVCDVVNRTLQRDLEVLKLDVTILEKKKTERHGNYYTSTTTNDL